MPYFYEEPYYCDDETDYGCEPLDDDYGYQPEYDESVNSNPDYASLDSYMEEVGYQEGLLDRNGDDEEEFIHDNQDAYGHLDAEAMYPDAVYYPEPSPSPSNYDEQPTPETFYPTITSPDHVESTSPIVYHDLDILRRDYEDGVPDAIAYMQEMEQLTDEYLADDEEYQAYHREHADACNTSPSIQTSNSENDTIQPPASSITYDDPDVLRRDYHNGVPEAITRMQELLRETEEYLQEDEDYQQYLAESAAKALSSPHISEIATTRNFTDSTELAAVPIHSLSRQQLALGQAPEAPLLSQTLPLDHSPVPILAHSLALATLQNQPQPSCSPVGTRERPKRWPHKNSTCPSQRTYHYSSNPGRQRPSPWPNKKQLWHAPPSKYTKRATNLKPPPSPPHKSSNNYPITRPPPWPNDLGEPVHLVAVLSSPPLRLNKHHHFRRKGSTLLSPLGERPPPWPIFEDTKSNPSLRNRRNAKRRLKAKSQASPHIIK